ncbi:MAG TPA: ABC transporter permease subunit, partial [Polyangia bacterium]
MRARFVLLSLGKELRETIRDRRTLAMMIFVPLVAYPLMALVGGQVVASKTRSQEARPSIVAVAGDHPAAAELKTRLDGKRTVFSRQAQGSQADVDSGSLDALVSLSGAGTGPAKAEIVFDATRDEGRQAEARLNDELTGMWPTGCAPRFSIESRDVAPKSRMGGYILSKILPMMILMMVLLGAFYPAIDLTAGERERGTLETVLVAPFRRSDLLLGKVLAVTILATLTGFLNLGSMSVTIVQVVNLAAPEAIVPVPFARAAATGLVILPMAFLFSSVFVAVGSLARGFKEAQNLLMPVYFVLVVPAMLGMMGELPLSSRLALLPGLNVTLLARDIALGKATLEHTVAVLMVTLAWAGLALVAATRFYVSERFINVGDPGQNKRRGWLRFGRGEESGAVESTARREPPTAGEAGVLFALGFLALLFVFFPLQRENMVKGLIITQWGGLFAGCLLYAIYTRRHMLTLLGFRRPGGHALTGAILMGLGGWMIANLVSQWAFPPSKEYLEAFRKLLITETRGLG